MAMSGCGGCRRSVPKTPEELEKELEERQAKLKEKERKPDFEVDRLVCQPYETKPDRPNEPKPAACWCKPGHWTAVALPAKANNDNFLGELEMSVIDGNNNVLPLLGMPFTMTGSRPAALPKGQPKIFDSVVYLPPNAKDSRVISRISERASGRGLIELSHLQTRPPAYQYHFVILARFPERYAFVKSLDSLRNPLDLKVSSPDTAFYHVVSLPGDRPATLPSHGLFWTSIAYLLWDEADATVMNLDQQDAMLDWLHWGGQLIISGPDTLDALRDSFLTPHLPAQSAGTRKLAQTDLDPLGESWSAKRANRPLRPLVLAKEWTGVALDKHDQARFIPETGDLVVERRVGRGRIVVTAFSLSAKELLAWAGYDQFFNGCLLGRSGRQFILNNSGGLGLLQVVWADRLTGFEQRSPVFPQQPVAAYDLHPEQLKQQLDPTRTCKLRYFSRDQEHRIELANLSTGTTLGQQPSGFAQDDGWLTYDADAGRLAGGGVACWSDFNPVAAAAREALQNAAQIEIPKASFVAWVVGVYLFVLVPLNWSFFRLIRRVEWAWIAAPIIALVCSAVVIHLARLDIGFARSASEITVVEMQPEYSRAHVTRYSALYTSLYTQYKALFDDPGALVAPFPTVARPAEFFSPIGQTYARLKYRHGTEVAMEGFAVSSNSTNFIHSEQMLDLGGPIALERAKDGSFAVTNHTGYALRGAGVLWNRGGARSQAEAESSNDVGRKESSPDLQAAWLGDIEPAATARLAFSPATKEPDALWQQERSRSPVIADAEGKEALNLRKLVLVAEQTADLQPGDMRLVGWIPEPISGQEIQPSAPQRRAATLVLAHLHYNFEPPQKDTRHRFEVDPDAPRVLRETNDE